MDAVTQIPTSFEARIVVPDESLRLASRCQGFLSIARAMVIDSDEMATEAMAEMKVIRTSAKQLKEMQTSLTAPAQQIIDNARAIFTPNIKAAEEAERIIKASLTSWEGEKQRRIAEARRKAEEEAAAARRKADEEAAAARAKAEAEAEELRAKAEAARAAGNAAQAAKLETRAEAKVEAADEKAAQLQIAAAAATPVVIEERKTEGFHTREKWVAEVKDFGAFLRAIADRPEYHSLVKEDQSALNKLASALKRAMKLDGVEVRCEAIAVART